MTKKTSKLNKSLCKSVYAFLMYGQHGHILFGPYESEDKQEFFKDNPQAIIMFVKALPISVSEGFVIHTDGNYYTAALGNVLEGLTLFGLYKNKDNLNPILWKNRFKNCSTVKLIRQY